MVTTLFANLFKNMTEKELRRWVEAFDSDQNVSIAEDPRFFELLSVSERNSIRYDKIARWLFPEFIGRDKQYYVFHDYLFKLRENYPLYNKEMQEAIKKRATDLNMLKNNVFVWNYLPDEIKKDKDFIAHLRGAVQSDTKLARQLYTILGSQERALLELPTPTAPDLQVFTLKKDQNDPGMKVYIPKSLLPKFEFLANLAEVADDGTDIPIPMDPAIVDPNFQKHISHLIILAEDKRLIEGYLKSFTKIDDCLSLAKCASYLGLSPEIHDEIDVRLDHLALDEKAATVYKRLPELKQAAKVYGLEHFAFRLERIASEYR